MSWKVYKVEKANGKKVIGYIGGSGDGFGSLPPMSEFGPNPGSTAFLPSLNKTFWLDGDGTWIRTDGLTLKSIAVGTAPTKTSYKYGDKLDLSGIIVAATYSDDTTTQNVQNSCVYSPADGSVLSQVGTITVTISYTEGETTKTATQSITVTADLTGIEFTTQPTKTEYTVGDSLDLTRAVITASYTDGSTDTVTATFDPADNTELTEEGTVTITASYTESSITKTTTTTVTVAAAESDDT